jgi:MoxR-like ATPase
VRKVHIEDALIDYMIEIVNRTRRHAEVQLGVSPRGTSALFRATQARAVANGRDFVVPDDVKSLVESVFVHRIAMKRNSGHGEGNARDLLREVLESVPVPA